MTHFGAARQHLFHDALIFYLLVFGAPYIIISRGNINHIRMEAKRNGEITRRKRWRNFMRNDSRNRDSPCRCLQMGLWGVQEKKRPKCEGKKMRLILQRRSLYTWIFIFFCNFYNVYTLYYITADYSVKFRDVYSFKSHTDGKQMKPKDVYGNYIILYYIVRAGVRRFGLWKWNSIIKKYILYLCYIMFVKKIFIITFTRFPRALYICNMFCFGFLLRTNYKRTSRGVKPPPEITSDDLW